MDRELAVACHDDSPHGKCRAISTIGCPRSLSPSWGDATHGIEGWMRTVGGVYRKGPSDVALIRLQTIVL
jgi:hypothetical protein